MEFKHFSHRHPLTLVEKIEDLETPAECKACKEVCVGPTYRCNQCSNFFLDKSCVELPPEFQSPYHHHHPLSLIVIKPKDAYLYDCHACQESPGLLAFRCEQCDLCLDVRCALLTIDEGQGHLLHFSHFHPLVFKQNHAANCSVCGEFSYGAFYRCEPCKFYLHQSCSQLQQKLQYFSHSCPLTLYITTKVHPFDIVCDACDGCIRSRTSYYHCQNNCKFSIDISCALLPSIKESEGLRLFYHFIHGHPLTLKNIKHDVEINCAICHRRCSGQSYVCCSNKCKFFSLHQSCFDLPHTMRHPIHRRHPLSLTNQFYKQCKVCSKECVGFAYHCGHCGFSLDVVCLTKLSMIEYRGHHHSLLFAPTWNIHEAYCHACDTRTLISSQIDSPAFRCFDCDFFLHLKCGPLPCTIEHENHTKDHPLTLTDSPVVIEREDRDGTDKFICDVCEKKDRDPRLPVYYCSEGCAYLAELECVISEVIHSIMGKHGKVELKTPIRHVPGKVIRTAMEMIELQEAEQGGKTDDTHTVEISPKLTFNDIIHSLMDGEMEELEIIIKASENDLNQDSSEVFSLIINAAEAHFQWLLYYLYHEHPKPWGVEKTVSIGDHLVPLSLAPILEDLCAKYGDFCAESTLKSSKLKTYFITILCVTINNMYATRVVDISEDHLGKWWANLKISRFAGFKVQFAFDRLKRVMHAHNGIQIEDEAKQKREELHCEIEEVSQSIEQLKAELATKTNMLEALKKRSKNIESEPDQFSGFKGDCLREASALRWKVAGEGLL